jgi:hypothetical protein
MGSSRTTIYLQPGAPTKPALGSACNGCGVCCASEPCPIGMLVTRRRHGTCAALRWVETQQHYRCGLLLERKAATANPLRTIGRALWHRWARRLIAAGSGCDAAVDVARPAP